MKWNEGRVMSSTASKVLVEKYLIKNTDLTMKVGTLGKIYVTFTFILNPGKYSHCKKGGGGGGGGYSYFQSLIGSRNINTKIKISYECKLFQYVLSYFKAE
jgi:hypothetical protein